MPAAPHPVNEAERLQKLTDCRILDTEPEPAFDDITALACRLCDTPIALISLVDTDRQWFKSRVGLDAIQTPRDQAFCGYTILGDDVLVIDDASRDERTRDNPLVTGPPHIRFYAGAPLRMDSGEALGTLCVIDYVPRTMNERQCEDLTRLARQAVRLLQGRIETSMLDDLSERLKLAVEGTNDGIWDWKNIEADEEWWSPKFYRLLGYEPNEIDSSVSTFKDLLHPDDVQRTWRAVKAAFDGTARFDVRYRLRHKSGEYRWFQGRGRVFRDADGQPVRMAGSIRDVQNLVEVENAAKMRERELRLILDSVPSLIYFKDGNNKILNLNKAAADAMKCEVADVIGRQSELFFPADDAATFLLDDREVLDSGKPKLGIIEHHEGAHGERLLIRTDKLPIQNEDGEYDRLVAIATDITAITEAQRKLRESENQLKAILDNAPSVIFAKRIDGRYLFVNQEYTKLFGLDSSYLRDKTDFDIFPTEIAKRFRAMDEQVTRMRMPLHLEESVPVNDAPRHYLTVKFPMFDANGEVMAVGGVATDITELKGAHAELERKNRELESFVYSASHDLKSPLVTILGYLSHMSRDLEDGNLEELPDFASRIKRAAERMRRSIDDLLELSRLGQVDSEVTQVDLKPVINETIAQEVVVAGREDICWELELTVEKLAIDPTHLLHICQNLIGNAIRYGTPDNNGKVIVGSRSLPNQRVQLFVRDFGPGIAPEHREKIFGLFQRLENDKKGTGVGLAIVRKIAEMYGGSATVAPVTGEGTEFVVELGMPQRSSAGAMEVEQGEKQSEQRDSIPVG